MTDRKQIHPDIPVEKAWQTGRRIYVRCGYESKLNKDLLALGSTWDKEVRVRWVGTGKRDKVIALVLAQSERVAAVEAIKALGFWVNIPYEAADIREAAKKAGGVFDNPQKLWAMPSQEALAEIKQLLADRAVSGMC